MIFIISIAHNCARNNVALTMRISQSEESIDLKIETLWFKRLRSCAVIESRCHGYEKSSAFEQTKKLHSLGWFIWESRQKVSCDKWLWFDSSSHSFECYLWRFQYSHETEQEYNCKIPSPTFQVQKNPLSQLFPVIMIIEIRFFHSNTSLSEE